MRTIVFMIPDSLIRQLHSRRGLLMLVNKRAMHLKYLKKHDLKVYRELIDKLSIRDK